ncbi:MBL fold metallo-hydrolase [Heyndrickxia acidicola]|uniref:MBL fold metallo-hydrolase n=1 Tax=Heyndrickxia acidicola TaxID=209389 RepID=A0ABU6MIK2_9BACI|nr:MBL fold metallo-hydrolase [Heyndrickxia acidicola]MED1204506.1 MBL fold metallo-hydrolase [Heyndrickxia acidicola]
MPEINSKHFRLEKIQEGVYAAIAKDGGGAAANAGIIDLGDKTIVFDTFNTQQAAGDLKEIAERITKQPVSWVVNSHWHGDHIRGNQILKNSNILASETTLQKMKENHPKRIAKQKEDISGLNHYIESLLQQSKISTDQKLEHNINFLREIALSLPTLELVLPQYTFKSEFTIYGTKRNAIISSLGTGHSECDSILYLPEDKIIFMGDLLFVETHPSIFPESNPLEWANTLNRMSKFDVKKVVPGHGPVGVTEDITKLKDYLNELITLSNTDINTEEILVPRKYKEWVSSELFIGNLRALKKAKCNPVL